MSALAKIKKTAARHEQDRQYDKALAQYARLLDGETGSDEEVDVTLYNRAGDLALRVGDVARAVAYFERAIDLYAAGGFLNNAVALAVKVLRHAPGHLAAHHTLGLLYSRKGFRAEARQHLAEYAAQMHRAGRVDEVRRTLAELAELGASPDEIAAARELLATRAAGPADAGALVKGFDEALGPAARTRPAAERAAAAPSVPLSELIEFEVRGQHHTPSELAAAPRWSVALPGDPAPLQLSAIRDQLASTPAGVGDVDPPEALDYTSDLGPAAGPTLLDLSTEAPAPPSPEPSAAEPFAAQSFVAESFEVDAPAFDIPFFEVTPLDAASSDLPFVDVPPVDAPSPQVASPGALDAAPVDLVVFDGLSTGAGAVDDLPPVDLDEIEARHFRELHGELVAALSPVEGAAAPPSLEGSTESGDGLDLGEWLRSTAVPASTRLVTPARRESGDEAADFDAALQAFTSGIAQSVDAGDRESHYDLGVAFREMGLLTDAVREFQRALAAPGGGLREREALAQSFLDLGRAELALATLERAAADAVAAGADAETLVGVFYVLAESARVVGRADDARAWYVRVLATDYAFRDAAARLAALPPPRTPAASR